LKNWISASKTNVIVIASSRLLPTLSAQVNNPRLISVDHKPPSTISVTTGRVKMPLRGSRGLRFIKSVSGGSTERARAAQRTGVSTFAHPAGLILNRWAHQE
jgi:hypothetical protein